MTQSHWDLHAANRRKDGHKVATASIDQYEHARFVAIVEACLLGGLAAGVLALTYGLMTYAVLGASPLQVCQTIASGILGKAAFQGGLATAIAGFAIHFVLATLMATGFVLLSLRFRIMRTSPMMWGILYGMGLYVLMHYVLVPLSMTDRGALPPWPLQNAGILVHAFFVGVPIAIVTQHFCPCIAKRGETCAE